MTQGKTGTKRYDRARRAGAPAQASVRAARTHARDLFNTYACMSDPSDIAAMDELFRQALACVYGRHKADAVDLYVDGSYNQAGGMAGIGVSVVTDASLEPWAGPNRILSKPVRAAGSLEAEIYAMAIGIAYVLDTFPSAKAIRLRYDCARSPVCAANLEAYLPKGAPYTNLRSAMARARRQGVVVLFEHVKAHNGSRANEACDTMAKYHAGVPLTRAQKTMAGKILDHGGHASAGGRHKTRKEEKKNADC